MPGAGPTIDLTDSAGLGMKRATKLFRISMISLGAFVIILFGLLAAVVWACAEDTNET